MCTVRALLQFSALQAGAEGIINALCGAVILKASAGRQLLEAPYCPNLTD